MEYSLTKKLITGVAIPVSSLRREKSMGIGEFSDLKYFADWCRDTGIDLIQLLPVNDTGFQSSPYSALSAFALHPAYINISLIPESKKYREEIDKVSKKWDSKERVYFNDVLKEKLKLLKTIYKDNFEIIEKSSNIEKWEKKNPWIVEYALFSYLKEKNNFAHWQEWEKYSEPSDGETKKLYSKFRKQTLFYSWVQYNLEKQLSEASEYINSLGINLKGDLPILMNVDSADVWAQREIFDISNRAGAPPDMYSDQGQNWGFPTYKWDVMEKNGFKWWKTRLKEAGKFYHAYRIDHVLGFFRIWTIPPMYNSGKMGYYSPGSNVSEEELAEIGISGSRLIWFTKPHIPGHELRGNLGMESNEVIRFFMDQINNEDLYLFKNSIESVNDIYMSDEISDEAKEKLVDFYHNIALIKTGEGKYSTTWFYNSSRAFQSMNDHEKYLFTELLRKKSDESMELWENQGRKLLGIMSHSEKMLVCAEDLGAIPDCVPKVLEDLGILGLHVTRWSKKYSEYGEPYIKPSEYNYLSVSTPAVHDSSTVREWWPELSATDEISKALNLDKRFEREPEEEEVTRFYEALLKTSSKIAMFQFQDILAIDKDLRREDAQSERINVPGSVNDINWSYRIDFTLEDLIKNKSFNKKVRDLINKRG